MVKVCLILLQLFLSARKEKKLGYVLPALVFLWVYLQTFSFGYLSENAFIWDFMFVAVLYVEYVAVSFFLTNEIKEP